MLHWRHIQITYKTKINIFLAVMAAIFLLGIFFFLKSDIFKLPAGKNVQKRVSEEPTANVTPQSKPEESVQQFLTSVHDALLTQELDVDEVAKATLLLTQKNVDIVLGKTAEITFQNLLDFLGITDPSYTTIEVTDSYFKTGRTIVQTKLKYVSETLKRNFTLNIENELWKIDDIQLINNIVTDPNAIKGWKTYTTSSYSIMTPANWFTVGTNPAEIQNFETSISDLTKLADGSIKITISYQKADTLKDTNDLIDCESIANNECTLVEINGTEFKKIVSSSQYETNNAVILAGQKNGNTYIISGVTVDKSDKNLFNLMLESISTLKIY